MRKCSKIILIGMVAILSGCQTSSLYHWAHYEPLLYSNYAKPGELPPQDQIELLKTDIAVAQEKGKPLPPGFYAQLGYLYAQVGDIESAINSFEIEKGTYPESVVFMDRLIQKLKNQ